VPSLGVVAKAYEKKGYSRVERNIGLIKDEKAVRDPQ